MENNLNWKNFFYSVILAFFTSFLTVYFFAERLETSKAKIAIEQKLAEKKIEVTENVIRDASTLYQLALLHKSIDLMTAKMPPVLTNMAKSLKEDQFIDKKMVLNAQKEFQISFFSSNPFINHEIYEILSNFGVSINQFLHQSYTGDKLLNSHKNAASEYILKAMNKSRKEFALDMLSKDEVKNKNSISNNLFSNQSMNFAHKQRAPDSQSYASSAGY